MSSGNWFKIHRSYAECEALGHGTDWNLVGAWVAILAEARHDRKPTTFAGQVIERGEFGFTYRSLQDAWGKSPNKLKAIFDHFEEHEMIEVRKAGKCSICRVLNYERYQSRKFSVTESVTEDSQRYQSSNASVITVDNASDNARGGLSIYKKKNVKNDVRARFKKPSTEEVKVYCQELANGVDAQRFHDYYTANGWTQGRGKPIKDWKAAVRTWERNGVQSGSQPTTRKMLTPPKER